MLLVVLTALFTRALVEVTNRDIGFDPARLAAVTAFAPQTGTAVPDRDFFQLATDRIRALPGVDGVALADHAPFDSSFHPVAASLDGRRYRVIQNQTSAEYFETLGARVLRGRTYSADEVATGAQVAVVTPGLARDFWPDSEVLGSTLERVSADLKDVRIIGIVTNAAPHIGSPGYSNAQAIYRPQGDEASLRIVVSLSEASPSPLGTLRSAVAALDSGRTVSARLVQESLEQQLQGPRILATLAGIVGTFALLLAVVGVFGVTAFTVQLRRRELGIQMAIGASKAEVVMTMFRQGMRPVLIGVSVGIGLGLVGSQAIAAALYAGISPRDPLAFTVAAVILILAASVGVWIPARRAAQVDPALSLRAE
jgi:hypothetical protein